MAQTPPLDSTTTGDSAPGPSSGEQLEQHTALQPRTVGFWRPALFVGIALMAVLFAFCAGGLFGSRVTDILDGPDPEPFEEIGDPVIQSIKDVADLTTVELVEYTTIEKGNDYGWLDWAVGDSISMFVVARIGAGVDLQGLSAEDFSVDQESGTVTVSLPDPTITFVALDNEATQVYNRDTGLFTSGDAQLESDARAAAEVVLVAQAQDKQILDRARINAEKFMAGLIENLGYPEVRFR